LLIAGHPVAVLASAPGYSSARHDLAAGAAQNTTARRDVLIRLEESQAAHVAGRVVDATGGSIAGALVSARGSAEAGAGASTALSDAAGLFRLEVPAGSTEVMAQAEAYSSSLRRVEAPANNLTLVLVPASNIVGHVFGSGADEPIAAARVSAVSLGGISIRALETRTAEDGSFELSGLAADRYVISASAEGWQETRTWVVLGLSESADLRLNLEPAGKLDANVSVGGEPCAGASLLLDGALSVSALAAADGALRLSNVQPGHYTARVSCPQALPLTEELDIALGEPLLRHWELDAGLSVRGLVQRANGQPLARASILVMPTDEATEETEDGTGEIDKKDGTGETEARQRTDAPKAVLAQAGGDRSSRECTADDSGAFECAGLAAGAYEVGLLQQEQARSPKVRVSLSPAVETSVVLRAYGSGTIRVRVAGVESSGAAFSVLARKEGEHTELQARPSAEQFVFPDIALGRYRVSLGSLESNGVTAALDRDGQVLNVELPAPSPRRIAGRVVDERGVPLPDAWVRASSETDFMMLQDSVGEPALTDEAGAFVLSGLVDGAYRLNATSPRGEATLPNVAAGSHDVLLRVPSYGALSGTVRTSDGAPVSNFSLSYTHENGDGASVPGSNGQWSIDWLAPGQYALSVDSELGAASASASVPESGETAQLTLTVHPESKPERERAANTGQP
jgi:hypothetical protein